MKRKYIVAVLLFYVFGICTLFSIKIERSMMTQATALKIDSIDKMEIPITALFQDAGGSYLYYAEEGIAWLEGLRAQECDSNHYSVDHSRQIIDGSFLGGQTIILSASRQPENDERINILQERQRIADRYLFLFAGACSPEGLSGKILLQSAEAILTEEPDAKTPFLEEEVKDRQADLYGQKYNIYSLNDAEQMAQSLSKIIELFAFSLLPILLLLFICIAPQKSPVLFWINLCISATVLAVMAYTLPKIQLSPSWMPAENIFDFGHYRAMFTQIKDGLRTLQYEKTLDIFTQSQRGAVWATIASVGATLLAVGAEVWIWKLLRKEK